MSTETIVVTTPGEQMALRWLEAHPAVYTAVGTFMALFALMILAFVLWTFYTVIKGNIEFDRQWKKRGRFSR